jgi:hypothetical protein
MSTFEEYLNEGSKIQIKRRYTEAYPAATVGRSARVRNSVLRAMKDGVVTEEEFNKILSELSSDPKRWRSTNSRYFFVGEDGIKLSKWGLRILAELDEEPKAAGLFEATVEMDAIDPDNKDFLKFLKKNRVKIINKVMDGPGGGTPVITMQGKRKDLEKVLADPELGWDDPDLAEYIEESVNENIKVIKDKFPYIEFKEGGKKYEVEFDQGDIIDDHGNEGKDWYYIGVDQFGDEWEIDVYTDSRDEPEDWFHDTIKRANESVVNEGFKFGTKNQYTIDDVNEEYGLWGTLEMEFSDWVVEEVFLNCFAILTNDYKFSDAGALYYLNAKSGRWLADQIIEKLPYKEGDQMDILYDIFNEYAKHVQWKKWSKEYNEYAQEELAENTNENMKQQFLYEKFSDFVEANFVNEKLGSMFFRDLLSKIGTYGNPKKVISDVAKSFYNATSIALDKLEDSDFIISNNPTDAYKNTRGRDEMLFWISDNEKDNPYADGSGWNTKIPGGGVLLCITSGDRQVYTNSWDRWAPKKGYKLTKTAFKGDDPVGRLDNTKYRGWGATGINNGKRLAEISDRVAIINVSLLKQKYSTDQIRTEREAAKKGATAFKSDKDFKAENLARYHEIIANKAAKLPLDSMVEDAINVLSSQIQDAIKAGKKDDYNNIVIGTNSKGRACTLRDATNHMSNILDDYSRYVGYIADAEESEKRYGQRESYYEKESKNYAKKIKERIAKIEKLDYAW